MNESICISKTLYDDMIQNITYKNVFDDFISYSKTKNIFTEGKSVIWEVNDYFTKDTKVKIKDKVEVALNLCEHGTIMYMSKSYKNSDTLYNAPQLLADIKKNVKDKLDLNEIVNKCPSITSLRKPSKEQHEEMNSFVKKIKDTIENGNK